jgi:hypothetical protein
MKKLYIFLLLITGFVTAFAQQPVSFSVQADADDWQLYMATRIMDDFNGNSKVVFITLTAGDEGNGTAAFNGSAVPYYMAREKGSVYSAKFASDISVNGQVCTIDTIPAMQTASINGHTLVKYEYKNTVSYFLRLPDGGAEGTGYAATGSKTLEKLETGEITSITSVDGANTYNGWNDLTETLLAIINAEKSNANLVWLHTGSLDETVNPDDNSDHIHAAMAAKDATEYLSWVGYIEYVNEHSATLPVNLSIPIFQDAAGIFAMANYGLTENKYASKLNAANIALLTRDYFTVVRNPSSCEKTDNLSTTNITSSSAVLRWRTIAGAVGYQVDYKTTGGGWISAGANITDSFVTVSNLSGATTYQWRVRTKCLSNGNGSGFEGAQFTTLVAITCMPPTGLVTNNITTTSAKLNWTAVSGAGSYRIEYKATTSATWIVAAAAATGTSYTLSALAPSVMYDWRIKTNCTSGISSAAYAQAQFTTLALCTDILEYNNSFYYAKTITTGLNYNAQIASCYDKDYYKFNNTSTAKNIKITVTDLPADYDVKLYNQYGWLVGISQNWGTTSETIVFNTTSYYGVGTYRVYVYGYGGAHNSTKCYNLKVEISSAPYTPVSNCFNLYARANSEEEKANEGGETVFVEEPVTDKLATDNSTTVKDLRVYPMPVYADATLAFEGSADGKALLTIFNANGVEVMKQQIAVKHGHNTVKVNMLNLASGVYTANIRYGTSVLTKQVIISR